jgi:hypothetical protein
VTDDPRDPFGATRLAHVDPATGAEAQPRLADRDATVIGALRPGGPSPRRRTAEFVPTVGARSTAEVTAAWSDAARGPTPGARIRSILGGPLLRRRPFGRALRVGALASLVPIAAALVALGGGRPAGSRGDGGPAATAPPAPVDAGAEVAAASPTPRRIAARETPPARLIDVVEAIGEGRLDDAREACAALSAAAPTDEALRAALEILGRTRDGAAP